MTIVRRIGHARAWARDASRRIDTAGVRIYAAAIAYRTIFSLVAFASTIVLVLYALGMDGVDVARHGGDVPAVPNDVEAVVRSRLSRTLDLGAGSVIAAGLAGFAFGVYGMSGGFAAICDVLDRVHGTQRYVRLTLRYLRGAGVALVFVALASVAIVLISLSTATGKWLLRHVGLAEMSGAISFVVMALVPCVALLVAHAFVLRYGSHARPPWREVVVGAIVAAASSVLLVFGFIAAVRLFDAWQTYGVLASAVVLLLFGYLQAYILVCCALFGREIAYPKEIAADA